jgi:hypothetical protein
VIHDYYDEQLERVQCRLAEVALEPAMELLVGPRRNWPPDTDLRRFLISMVNKVGYGADNLRNIGDALDEMPDKLPGDSNVLITQTSAG